MSEELPRLMFRRMTSPPPQGTLQFYDGLYSALPAGPYTLKVKHVVTPPDGSAPPSYHLEQAFNVDAPEFQLDPGAVGSVYPADGATAVLDHMVATLVLDDPALPWERNLVPNGATGPGQERPSWLALLLFAEGEIYLRPGTSTPLQTMTVSELLSADPNTTLAPQFPPKWVSPDLLSSQCQTILIPGTSWSVLPSRDDLKYLSHCRVVNAPDEDPGMVAVMFGNRLPLANTAATPAAPLKYYAHLVSLEGFADYLEPGLPLPQKKFGSGPVDVRMVSLYSWSFVSLPDTGIDYEQLIEGLITSQTQTPVLRLAPEMTVPLPLPVSDRLSQGYAPITLRSLSGEESFAWYRGPFSAVVPQSLPAVGNPPVPVSAATSADELMIYIADQGLFDLSYAAAWNMGRGLALANSGFAKAIARYRRTARTGVQMMAQRRSISLTADASLSSLPGCGEVKRSFSRKIGAGLARDWTEAMRAIAGKSERGRMSGRPPRLRRPPQPTLAPMAILAERGMSEVLAAYVADAADPVADWLAALSRLEPVPFSSLVPDPRMVPVESIRFFYLDPTWIDALVAGALSLGVSTLLDLAIAGVLAPDLMARMKDAGRRKLKRRFGERELGGSPVPASGLLIRSQVISSWPTLAIGGSAAGVPLNVVRDAVLAPGVRLVMFEGIPDTVMLAEPYQGLQFGVPENGVVPRYVTSAGPIGGEMPVPPVPPGGYSAFLATYTNAARPGVILVSTLAGALRTSTGAGSTFGAGDFALQMVSAPEMQLFKATTHIGVNA